MDSKPLVSTILIFLNAAPFIEEAIQSVFAQRYDGWELLLVDDGSTDGSIAIAQRYAAQHPGNVRYLEHENHRNRGMSASRNLGINHAQGTYIAFLDADDVWLPHKLEEQVAILESQPEAAMIYGRTQIWHSWTGKPRDRDRDFFYALGVPADTLIRPPTLFLLLLENKAQTPTTCNMVVRRTVFEEIGGFEESFRGMYEDQAFCTKIFLKAPVFVADAYWARYRQHAESCGAVAGESVAYHAGRLPLLTWMETYLAGEGIDSDSEAWQALQRALWWAHHPRWSRLHSALWHFVGTIKERWRR